MGMLKRPYDPYVIHSKRHVSIFGLRGELVPQGWKLGVSPVGYPHPVYASSVIEPYPLLQKVIDLLAEDRERNVLEEVQKVAISNRVAVHLYLEGVIVARDLRDSSLGRTDISSWVEHYEDVDYIRTPWVLSLIHI